MKTLSELKKNSAANLQKLQKKADTVAKGAAFSDDETYWSVERNKEGNGSAVIRFLPCPENEEDDIVRLIEFSFKGPTGLWYIEKSPTTIGAKCPVNDYLRPFWADKDDNKLQGVLTGGKKSEEYAKSFGRRVRFVSNIYIIKDTMQPETVENVYRWKFGKSILEKVQEALHPSFEDKAAFNPYDFWSGHNFILRVKQKDKFPNYDDSAFSDTESVVASSEDEIQKIWNNTHSLMSIHDPGNFKSYEDLKKRFMEVMDFVEDDEGNLGPRKSKSTSSSSSSTSRRHTKTDENKEETPKTETKASSKEMSVKNKELFDTVDELVKGLNDE